MRLAAAISLLLAATSWVTFGCSSDDETRTACTSPTTFTNDIQPAIIQPKCLPCHSTTLRGTARRGAPEGLDFDTYELVAARAADIVDAVTSGREPPPTLTPPIEVAPEDRDLMRAWRTCGYPK